MSRRPRTLLLAPLALVVAGACGHHDASHHDHDHDHDHGAHDGDTAAVPASSAEVVRAQLASYPLETCAVSGEELGSMGTPLDHVVDDRLVRLCCKSCVKELEANPAEYVAKVDAAVVAAQLAAYPVTTCVVSGEELGSMGTPIDRVVNNRLVRLCCKSCNKELDANPQTYLAKLSTAPR